MNLLSEAVKQEIENIVIAKAQKLNKEEMKEIVVEIMMQLDKSVEKQVTKYFRHMASLIIYDGAFKEDST